MRDVFKGNQSNALKVKISRHVSNNQTEDIECEDFEYLNGYHSFFCYPSNGALSSNYRPGFDSHFVDIFGEVYIDSCDFTDIVKLYSYPSKLTSGRFKECKYLLYIFSLFSHFMW